MTKWEQRELIGLPAVSAEELEALLKSAEADRLEHKRWEAKWLEERMETRRLKSERRREAKQRVKMERWQVIARETARRAQLKDVKA